MAGVMPDLRLPSQLQNAASSWPLPDYAAWWQSNVDVWHSVEKTLFWPNISIH